MTIHHKILLRAIREYADIEIMFAVHGGDTKLLWEKARELSRTTTMNFRQAVQQVLDEDLQTRQEPTGFLNWKKDE